MFHLGMKRHGGASVFMGDACGLDLTRSGSRHGSTTRRSTRLTGRETRHTGGVSGVIAVLNGPNLNLLGEREPTIYGSATLADVEKRTREYAAGLGFEIDFRQSNHEGVLIDAIHELRSSAVGFVVNAGALTHTSIAIRDALAAVTGPIVEVHLSNVHAREEFRHLSYVAGIATAVIAGCGPQGYEFAVATIAERVRARG